MTHSLSPALQALINDRYDQLVARAEEADVAMPADQETTEAVRRTLLVSDFAFEVWRSQPQWLSAEGLARLRAPEDARSRQGALELAGEESAVMRSLRRFRRIESLRLVFRDVNDLDQLPATLAATSALYEVLLDAALGWAQRQLQTRFGLARGDGEAVQQLLVIAFGKLGGSELNFSSDIDLVMAYPQPGKSDGARSLDNSEYFVRLVRQLVRLLAEPTVDGICARVDLRLRPFGKAGRLALPFAAMEHYYQSEGRDWERYAWIKAHAVVGEDADAGQLFQLLRPFIYRKYLDYTAFAGLREMKALIDAEVARKDLAANLKLGPGGIREIEFIVQLTQLIRGGREPSLRVRGLLSALEACQARGHIPPARAVALRDSYEFLRRLENRVQMLRDAQTHDVPDDALSRERLALGLGYASWDELGTLLKAHRAVVSEEFAAVLMPQGGRRASVPAADTALWQQARDEELQPESMEASGFSPGAAAAEALIKLPQATTVRNMTPPSRERLHRLMPHLLGAARDTAAPVPCLLRLCRLVQAVARRSSYLALLEEQPSARRRLADVFANSAFLAERVIAQPLLLDDVLDPRIDEIPLKRADITKEIGRLMATLEERGAEFELERLNEFQSSISFRLGLAFQDGRANAVATARRLAALAESVVAAVTALAERELVAQHGRLPGEGSGLAVLGYGSLGGEELGFASDLDLVFVYDSQRAALMSDGARPLEGARWYQRLVQRVLNWLNMLTRAGRLYEIDTRLRPDGSKGLLVSSLDSFSAYQRSRAWTWEHQALLRARLVTGDAALSEHVAQVRREVLSAPRQPDAVASEVSDMRRRWRSQRNRSNEELFDLKQGHGGLLDIEFALQGVVLAHASAYPALLMVARNASLIDACRASGLLQVEHAQILEQAHVDLLQRALVCTLDLRSRVTPRDERLEQLAAGVREVTAALGFAFD